MLGSAVDLDDNGAHVRVAQRLWKTQTAHGEPGNPLRFGRQDIESAFTRSVPEIAQIIDTTDHAAGKNPDYQPSK